MARTQYRHFSADDVVGFFKELLDRLNRAYPNKSFVFVGDDNLGLHKSILPLFERDENKRHSFIPNPPLSPFLNAGEYVFSQIKRQVLGRPYKRLRHLTEAVHQSFERIRPEHLANYNKIVQHYLHKCLRGEEEIHPQREEITEKEEVQQQGDAKQKWDVKHRQLFETEKIGENKPLRATADARPLAHNQTEMVVKGQRLQLYPQ